MTVVHDYTVNRPRDFQIVETDMFSYAIASACYNYGVMHQEQFIVLTRTKTPSMITKKNILNALSTRLGMSDEDISKLEKGNAHDCWGDDHHM